MDKNSIRKIFYRNKALIKLYKILSEYQEKRRRKLDDETYLRIRYKENTGKDINLDNPITFDEKRLWLQLHDRNPIYTELTDKIKVKEYVAEKIGKEHIVPIIGIWDNVNDIPFDELPEEYVLKCNHDCGSVFIKRKDRILTQKKINKIKKQFAKALQRNYFDISRTWGYKNIKPKVFAEALIFTRNGRVPADYKVFCFNGVPKFFSVIVERSEGLRCLYYDCYDLEWNRIHVKLPQYPSSNDDIPCPDRLSDMIEYARILSEGFPHVRVDFFIDGYGEVLHGEMTFCAEGGISDLQPESYNILFGSWIELPDCKK